MLGGDFERRYSILLADDDAAARDTLREIVAPLGYRTLVASDGMEALEIVRQEIIHAALFDMHMPNMTGLEALQALRQFNADLPVILITADSSAVLMRQAFQAQAYSVIPKPFSRSVVLHTLNRALGRLRGDRIH